MENFESRKTFKENFWVTEKFESRKTLSYGKLSRKALSHGKQKQYFMHDIILSHKHNIYNRDILIFFPETLINIFFSVNHVTNVIIVKKLLEQRED